MKKLYASLAIASLLFLNQELTAQCFVAATHTVMTPCQIQFIGTGSMTSVLMWDFGDASNGTGNTPQHTYAANGTYTVCCIGLDMNGSPCDTACFPVTISGCSQSSSCTVVGTQIPNGPCSFTFIASGTASTYAWDFGDSQAGTGTTVQHTYSANGNYNVCVVGYDTTGAPCDTFCMTAAVTNCTLASCTIVGTQIPNGPCSFTFIVSGTAATYAWNFGDSQTGTGNTVQHTYAGNGTYQVCVIGYDAQSLSCDTFCMTAVVSNCTSSSCTVITTSTQITPCTVQFIATGLGAATYTWSFGDSQSGTGAAPQHTYASNGTYTACCVGLDSNGIACDTSCMTIVITGCVSGIEETEALEVKLFPNPVNEQLNVQLLSSGVEYWTITDITGREVLSGSVSSPTFAINTSGMPEGMYLLVLYSGENAVAGVRQIVLSK